MLIPRLVRSVQEGQPIVLQGKEGIKINPIFVTDAVEAIMRALVLEGSHKINVAGLEMLTMRGIGEIIGEVVGKSPNFEVKEDESPKNLIGDITKMSQLLEVPKVSFREGVEKLISMT